jgi:ribosomal protein L40E
MENPSSPPSLPLTCPSCGSPVEPGHKFCEICGTKVEDLPICRKCGARFITPVKFCESCGTPVLPPDKQKVVVSTPADPVPASPTRPEVTNTSAVTASPSPGTPKGVAGSSPFPQSAPPKAPMNKALVLGGVIVLLVVIAGAFFVGLPMLQGNNAGSGASQPTPVPTVAQTALPTVIPTTQPTTVKTPVPTTLSGSLVPLPTQQPPKSQQVFFQVQKDQVNAGITVLFAGGPGSNSVSNADVRVTHPDGKVVTGTIQPSKGVTEITLSGSKETDRVEVIAKMYNGQTYRVIDELLTYKER